MKNMAVALAVIAATQASVWVSTAHAYIPPTDFILRTLVKKHDLGKGVRVKTTVTAMEKEAPTDVHFKEITVFNPGNGTLKSWVVDDSGQTLYGVERGPKELTLVSALLLETIPQRLSGMLKRNGVDLAGPESSGLARWKRTYAWVLGQKPQAKAELWVEKDTFLPIRWLWAQGARDVELSGFKVSHDFNYPRLMTHSRASSGGAKPEMVTVFKAEATEVAANLDVSNVKAPATEGFTAHGEAAPEPVKELIRKYYEVMR